MNVIAHNCKRIQRYSFVGNKVLKVFNNLMFIFILAKQRLPLQYSCRVELCPGVGVLFHTVNVIIIFAVPTLEDMVFDTYSSAVGENTQQRLAGIGWLL